MNYVLAMNVIGLHHQVPLAEASFAAAKRAFDLLSEFVLLEERFDAAASGFLDFEKEMMAKLLDFTYAGFKDGLHQMAMRRHLNRLLMNTLSAARGFIDHLPHTCNLSFGKGDARNDECIALLSRSYDELSGYRICEALRNHSQHAGFPIQSVTYSTQMEGEMPGMWARGSISPMVDTDVLRRNSRFKPPILKEMEGMGKRIDLKPLLREYIAGIASAHYRFREHSRPMAQAAEAQLADLIRQYRTATPESEDYLGLCAVAINDNGEWIERTPLSTGITDYWTYLASSNPHFRRQGNSFLATSGRSDA